MAELQAKVKITASDRATAPINRIGNKIDQLKLKTGGIKTAFANVGNAARNLGAHFRFLGISMGALSVIGIEELVRRTADLGDNLDKASQKAGVTVEFLQKMRFAAHLSGVGVETLDMGVKFLSKSLSMAKNPSSMQAKAFKAMGIEGDILKGKIKDVPGLYLRMSDIFHKTADGAKKVTTSMATMGLSGQQMIPLMDIGPKKFNELSKQLERVGFIMDKKTTKQMAKFNDNLFILQTGIKGIGMQIVADFIPSLNGSSDSMEKYLEKNKKVIALKIEQKIKDVIAEFKKLGAIISPVWEKIGGLSGAFKILIGLIGASFVAKLVSIGSAFIQLGKAVFILNGALLATPLIGFVVAVGELGAALYELETNFDSIQKSIDAFVSKIEKKFPATIKIFKDLQKVLGLISKEVRATAIAMGVPTAIAGGLRSFALTPTPKTQPTRIGGMTRASDLNTVMRPQQINLNVGFDRRGLPIINKFSSPTAAINVTQNTGIMFP